ncbi:hypothetical protein Syun_022572 [Stephania yunnanensis]|uniref:Uncharacterized protein n=1 Tax=Stephania yunnanensis TaxID=152371 RepID=A0AAP0I2V5_9MAGN
MDSFDFVGDGGATGSAMVGVAEPVGRGGNGGGTSLANGSTMVGVESHPNLRKRREERRLKKKIKKKNSLVSGETRGGRKGRHARPAGPKLVDAAQPAGLAQPA